MSGRYAKLPRGIGWEYRVHRAAFLSGWYVRRSVNLRERVRGSPQTMAEVDIVGLDFDVALTRRMLVGECKDRKGGAKEADRVVWLLGLARMLGADHILFAKTELAEGTLQVARPYGVMLWDKAAVLAVEQRFDLSPDSGYYGSSNVELREELLLPSRKGAALRDPAFRAAWDFLGGAFWYQANPQRTKRLASYFDALTADRSLSGDVRSAFVAEGLIALLVTLYSTGGQLAVASPARSNAWLHDAFASGAADARALRDIAARADDYYQDALHKAVQGAGQDASHAVHVPRLAGVIAEPPPWLGAYLDVASTLAERPGLATDALRYADLFLFEQLLAGNDASIALSSYVKQSYAELARILELAALFLQRVWGVDDSVLDKILATRAAGRGHKPRRGQGTPKTKQAAEQTADQLALSTTPSRKDPPGG